MQVEADVAVPKLIGSLRLQVSRDTCTGTARAGVATDAKTPRFDISPRG